MVLPWSFHLDHSYSSVKFQSTFSENVTSAVSLSSYFKTFSQTFFKLKTVEPVLKKHFKVIRISNKIHRTIGKAKDLQLWECVSSVLN